MASATPDLRLPFQSAPIPSLCYLMTVAAQDINTEEQGLNAIITLTELGITLHYIKLTLQFLGCSKLQLQGPCFNFYSQSPVTPSISALKTVIKCSETQKKAKCT